ncbi:hypothetical protein IFT66_10410 [Rhizobium sp. CFBP 13726]|uniref:hypothetical protein n=1 Tax=Rhizobium sp. CFBP 13726 TaxID=2775296 RepID=UPI00178729B8|nr:hypothetical protein [Rhizobium sp. CFBP 13726]MBD8651490.1 hypothetical protein [Rhizobium sp. CFBP 13726]
MEVTNSSKAPQGIHTLTGVVFVLPGQTKTVRLNKTLESHAKGLDFFELDGEAEEDELGSADASGAVRVTAEQMDDLRKKFEEQVAEIGRLTSENTDLTTTVGERDATIETLNGEIVGLKASLEAASQPKDNGTTPEFAIKEKSPGWFVIVKGDAEVTKSLRKDDVAEFPTMSADDKAAFVELNKQS